MFLHVALALTLQQPAPPSLALATTEGITVLSFEGKLLRKIAGEATTFRWSPDGKRLAIIHKDGSLAIDSFIPGIEEEQGLLVKAASIAWSRDGKLLFSSPGKGIQIVDPGGLPNLVTPVGQYPAPSPDGSQLAYTTSGVSGGLWISRTDGSQPLRIARASETGQASWSYDGRRIAVVLDGKLKMLSPNSRLLRDLGEVSGPVAEWSAGSPGLLAQKAGKWATWNDLEEKWTELPLDGAIQPEWVGPQSLLGVRQGHAMTLRIGKEPEPIDFQGSVIGAQRVVSAYMGASFPNPYAAAPRPSRGQSAWIGRLRTSDPLNDQVTMDVDSEIEGSGKETVFGKPQTRTAKLRSDLIRKLTLLPNTDLWLVVSGNSATDAFIPGEAVTPATPVTTFHEPRSKRNTEYDGVSMDHVVVPMIYPFPGKHKFVDTFLAPRDGGNRRHHGNDLMSPKMTPLLAVFDGVVYFNRTNQPMTHNVLSLRSDDGWVATYMHINNDTPGTDDGVGSLRYAFPADLQSGDRVKAGQLIAYCGDSGNAEDAGSHCHFELYDEDGGAVLDPAFSLKAAQHIPEPRYANPDPSVVAKRGETKWDVVISSTDPVRNVVTAELVGQGSGTKSDRRCCKPQLVYLTFPPTALVRYLGADLSYPPSALRPGFHLSAAGAVTGSRIAVRDSSMALPGG